MGFLHPTPRRRQGPGLAAWALLPILALAPAPARAATGEWAQTDHTRVRLITPYAVAPAGGEIRLGLHVRLAEGWHIYWKNSGDAGYPPEVDFSPTPRVTSAHLLWPAPERYEVPGDLVALGYEDEVVYPIMARLEAEAGAAAGGTVVLTAEVDYVVCEVDCIPYHHRLTVEQALGAAATPDPEMEALLAAWEERVPRPPEGLPGVGTRAFLTPRAQDAAELTVEVTGGGGRPGTTDLFLEAHDLFEAGRPRAAAVAGGIRFTVPLALRDVTRPLPSEATFAWTVTGLEMDGEDTSLEARRTVGPPSAADAAPAAGRPGLPAILGGALLGGFLLNLTPGVLALLLLVRLELGIASRRAETRRRVLTTAGSAIASWTAVVAALAAARGAGWRVGWGVQFEEGTLLTALSVVLLLFCLYLWGLLGSRSWGRGAFALAGAAAALLALPWDVPYLSGALSSALARGAAVALPAGLAAGLGLALPYAAPALFPTLIPRLAAGGGGDGAAVRRRREALGFLAAAGGVWLLYVLSGVLSAPRLAFVELALLGLALAAWLRNRLSGRRSRAILTAALAAAAILCVALAAGELPSRSRAEPPSAAASPIDSHRQGD